MCAAVYCYEYWRVSCEWTIDLCVCLVFRPLRIGAYEQFAPSVSVWGAQIYRGSTFAGFFEEFESSTKRLLLVTEYGIDSYDDNDRSQWAVPFNPDAAARGQIIQAEYDVRLAQEIDRHHPTRGGSVLGGCVMEWSDEYWKNADSNVKRCPNGLESAGECEAGAHAGCPRAPDDQGHAICGYPLQSAPDGYSNEAWFGLVDGDGRTPKAVYTALQRFWTGGGTTQFELETSKHSDAGGAGGGGGDAGGGDALAHHPIVTTHWSIYAWFILFVATVIKLTVYSSPPLEQWQARQRFCQSARGSTSSGAGAGVGGGEAPVTIKDRYISVPVCSGAPPPHRPTPTADETTYLLATTKL